MLFVNNNHLCLGYKYTMGKRIEYMHLIPWIHHRGSEQLSSKNVFVECTHVHMVSRADLPNMVEM
jgi:hypothetical protein